MGFSLEALALPSYMTSYRMTTQPPFIFHGFMPVYNACIRCNAQILSQV